MNDSISRQAAIDEANAWFLDCFKVNKQDRSCGLIRRLEDLPPTQPEIIYCKDCKHFIREDIEEYTPYGFYNTYFHAFCDKHWDEEQGEYIDVKIDDFCSFAERRREQGG